jgi:hypothetical protein
LHSPSSRIISYHTYFLENGELASDILGPKHNGLEITKVMDSLVAVARIKLRIGARKLYHFSTQIRKREIWIIYDGTLDLI